MVSPIGILMYVYTSVTDLPHKIIGPAIRKVATQRTSNVELVERLVQEETLFYSDDGVFLLGEKDGLIKKLKLHDSQCETIELSDGGALMCDKSYWSFTEDSFYLSPSYVCQEVIREIYRLPDAPCVSLIVETRNNMLHDIHFECKNNVPIDSIMEDINIFMMFIDKHCVNKRA